MSGLLLVGVLGIWILIAVVIGKKLTSKLKNSRFKPFITFLVIVAIIPLPVLDEIIGRYQLKALCERNGPKEIEFARVKNSILLVHPESSSIVKSQLLPTIGRKTTFIDKASSKKVISFVDYDVESGLLIHALGISETSSPLTFSTGCFSEPFQDWLDRYQIKLVFEQSGGKS